MKTLKLRQITLLAAVLSCLLCRAQVSGIVLDEHGEPLIGANVYWAETGVGDAYLRLS